MSKWIEVCEKYGIERKPHYNYTDGYQYPQFTAEKGMKIIDFFADSSVSIDKSPSRDEYMVSLMSEVAKGYGKTLDEAFEDLLINVYDDLLEAEQQAIKNILKEEYCWRKV